MKHFLLIGVLAFIGLASCKTFKVGVPDSLRENGDKFRVKGTSVSVFGHKIKIDGFGEGRMYSGFTTTSGTEKRLFPLYFDLDARMNYISNHFSKKIERSKTRFRFDFVKGNIYANTYCEAQSTETSLDIKSGNWSIPLSDNYRFSGLIYTNKETAPWRIDFSGKREINEGLKSLIKNTRQTDGTLTNDKETIGINVVRIKTRREDSITKKTLFPIVAGYEFIRHDRRVAFVDIFDKNIWVDKSVDELTRVILVSASTSILVKTNSD